MEGWSAQRVLDLAPDPASAKAGQGLASARKWVSSGRDDAAAWGECQGSGAKPYQVQVDLSGPSFKCSCPSRKFPCKHGIGLMLLYAADQVAAGAQPPWVQAWLASRTERQKKKEAKAAEPPKPVDEAAQAKRREKRLDRVRDGLAALKLWAEDQVRAGVATAPTRGYAYFDEQARRMVDAQAPGVARRIYELAATASAGAGWQRAFVEGLAFVHLLCVAFERAMDLPDATRDDVFAALGLPLTQEEVLALPPVRDRWQIVAQETRVEERLRVQRSWLYGVETKRSALVLAFAHGAGPLDTTLAPGYSFEGELCFFPGNSTRALVKSRQDPKPFTDVGGVDTLDALCDAYSSQRAKQPWAEEIALPLKRVATCRRDDRWELVDRTGGALPATMTDATGWSVLAQTGGHAADVVVAFDGKRVRPLALLAEGEYLSLAAAETEVAA